MMNTMLLLPLLLLPLLLLITTITKLTAANTIISNVQLRNDTTNRVVNSHDGCLVKLPSSSNPNAPLLYYQYGTVYENCTQAKAVCDGQCGYFNNTFSVYSSPDLQTWTLLSDNVVPEMSKDNIKVSYWLANVGYNKLIKKYVMIYWSGHYGFIDNRIAVAVSDTPGGPFVNVAPIAVRGCAAISDTVALFVDDDNTAYVRYNTWSLPKQHIVEKLTADWLDTTGNYSIIFTKPDFPWYDGGGMFHRDQTYFVMLSFDCCFCQWGSDAVVFYAPSTLGPWRPQTNATSDVAVIADKKLAAAADPVPPANWTNEVNFCSTGQQPPPHVENMYINPCSQLNVNGPNFTIPSQQFSVAVLTNSSGDKTFLYYGEHFRSSVDGLKSHDLQAWIPLNFKDNRILPMQWLDSFEVWP